MILVYLIRHAESTGNAEHRLGGLTDFPLTDRGKGQARQAADFVLGFQSPDYPFRQSGAGTPFTAIYTSPLRRAKETAKPLAERLSAEQSEDFDFIEDERITEIDAGKLDGAPFAELGEYAELVRRIPYHPDLAFPGGESHGDVIRRTQSFVKDLLKRHPVPGREDTMPYGSVELRERVAVFSHGITVNYLLHHLLEIPTEGIHRFPAANAAINIVELARGFPRLLLYNYSPESSSMPKE
ncbi:MAG: hypothetical protein B1H03_01215 [Planctomycetales bacterium 4484_113]|nr:MAG: hypothetical protein B1H03_01215 [Planctomycetales bacterium 4484_113]